MRRDICYRFSVDVKTLYNAYLQAAQQPPFERSCKQEPYHTFNFGLNYSFKYNMNGGSCILHFIPYEGGSAVDLRFVIAQAFGAKYENYAQDLTDRVNAILGEKGRPANIPIETFTNVNNKVDANKPAPAAPVAAPAPAAMGAAATVYCSNCGKAIRPEDQFCSGCGTRQVRQQKFCTGCGAPADPNAAFCIACGTKL